MTALLDQNLSFRLAPLIGGVFTEVHHVQSIGLSGKSDREIWQVARLNNWVIVSKDADFADMALLYGAPPKVIRLKLGNCTWEEPATAINRWADPIRDFLQDGESSLLVIGR